MVSVHYLLPVILACEAKCLPLCSQRDLLIQLQENVESFV